MKRTNKAHSHRDIVTKSLLINFSATKEASKKGPRLNTLPVMVVFCFIAQTTDH